MSEKKKKTIPGSAIGLYICSVIMGILFLLSILGIVIGGTDGTRPFFIITAVVTLIMTAACIFVAKWLTEKASSKKKAFASYAFEGEFAPQKKNPSAAKKTKKH